MGFVGGVRTVGVLCVEILAFLFHIILGLTSSGSNVVPVLHSKTTHVVTVL